MISIIVEVTPEKIIFFFSCIHIALTLKFIIFLL